ncbi:hypothetical protein evm_005678 [Chilo suppressalis]|nr:hypothetical protein evm_005678 [Chilo suppressalis]
MGKQIGIARGINDSWKRIADTMGIPMHELKKKKDNLLATLRINLKRKNISMKSGAGVEEVYQPIWMFYNVMAAFLTDIYESTSHMNTEEKTQPVLYEEASASNVQASDIPPEAKNDVVPPTPQKNPIGPVQKRRATNPSELHEASKKMSTAFTALNSALSSKERGKEEDECDLYCKMLAKQIKEYPKLEREEIMYELHGIMLNRRRRYNKMMQGRSYTVSSPSQVILSRPSTSNSVYLSKTPSPSYLTDSSFSFEQLPQNVVNQQSEAINVLSQEIIQPETSRACYEGFGNVLNGTEQH